MDTSNTDRFCKTCLQLEDTNADNELCRADAPVLKTFFQKIIDTAKRPQQASTLQQYFRVLKMVHDKMSPTPLDSKIVDDVNAVREVDPRLMQKTNSRIASLLHITQKGRKRRRLGRNRFHLVSISFR